MGTRLIEGRGMGMKLPRLFLIGFFCGLVAIGSSADRPNILFIFSDDHSHNAIGAYDGWLKSIDPTPNIDDLAADGMTFLNSYCTNSICGPSRAVIQTGKFSHKNGFRQNGESFDWDQQTFPKLMQQAGYQTAMYGKTHLKGIPQGYDDWSVLPGQGLYYNPDFITPEGKVTIEGHCTDVVTDMAVDWLKENRDAERPFILMVQHKAPHRNWMPAERHLNLYDDIEIPEPPTLFDRMEDNAPGARNQHMEIDRHMHLTFDLFVDLSVDTPKITQKGIDRSAWGNMKRMTEPQLEAWHAAYRPKNEAFHRAELSGQDLIRWKFQRYMKNYLRCIKGVDESVGTLRDTLEELGLSENTIVIYSSDQGFYLGDHGWYDKRWMYEESMMMPFIAAWPGKTEAGSKSTALIQNIDYAETFLDLAGASISDDMQGQSLVPLLEGGSAEGFRDALYYHYYEYPQEPGLFRSHMVPRHNGIRTERYKLLNFYQFGEWELYDLENDPDELTNIYTSADKALVDRLKSELESLVDTYQDDSDFSAFPADVQKQFWPDDR